MFIGRIDAKVDPKGRVSVPAVFRRQLTEGEPLVGRMDAGNRYLVVYGAGEWQQKVASLEARLDEWNEQDNDLLMQFVDDAVELTVDAQGRLLLPKQQKERIGISAEVTFVGMGTRFAIWDKQRYAENAERRAPFRVPGREGNGEGIRD